MLSVALGLLQGNQRAELENERTRRLGVADDRAERDYAAKELERRRAEAQRRAQAEARARLAANPEIAGRYGTTDDEIDQNFDYLAAERREAEIAGLADDLEAMGFSSGDARIYARTGKDPSSTREYNRARADAQRAAARRGTAGAQVRVLDKQINDQQEVLNRTTSEETKKIPTKRPPMARIDPVLAAKFVADSTRADSSAKANIGRERERFDQLRDRRRDFEAMGFPMGVDVPDPYTDLPGYSAVPGAGLPMPSLGAPGAAVSGGAPTPQPVQQQIALKLQETIAAIMANPLLDDAEKQRRVQLANEATSEALAGLQTP